MGTRWETSGSAATFFWDITQRRVGIPYRRPIQPVGPIIKIKKSKNIYLHVKGGPMNCPDASVRNSHYTPHNIPEERRPSDAVCLLWGSNWIINCIYVHFWPLRFYFLAAMLLRVQVVCNKQNGIRSLKTRALSTQLCATIKLPQFSIYFMK